MQLYLQTRKKIIEISYSVRFPQRAAVRTHWVLSRAPPQRTFPSFRLTSTWYSLSLLHDPPPRILFSTILPDAAAEPNNVQPNRQKLQNKTNRTMLIQSRSLKGMNTCVSVNVVRKRKHTCKHQEQKKPGMHHNDCSQSTPVWSSICQTIYIPHL